ncbi:hypothetical protein Leryth_005220 [Lithospermum erythrorhizon]|nr:hypothetical protein Leryth_005220 [Lithospermum erythrorhizon]
MIARYIHRNHGLLQRKKLIYDSHQLPQQEVWDVPFMLSVLLAEEMFLCLGSTSMKNCPELGKFVSLGMGSDTCDETHNISFAFSDERNGSFNNSAALNRSSTSEPQNTTSPDVPDAATHHRH